MTTADPRRRDEALNWVMRIHDAGFTDWEGHAAWLEADPRNLDAFDEAALSIDAVAQGLAPAPAREAGPRPVNDNPPRDAGRRAWGRRAAFGGAIAAGLVALVAVPSLMKGGPSPLLIQTVPGEQRGFTMTDGTQILLNGDSAVTIDRSGTRSASLDRGEAYFVVTHDAAHPFSVHAGEAVFQDIGTAFDAKRHGETVDVAVREGAVMYDPAGSAVRLDQGQAIRVARGTATVKPVDTAGVGSWRGGRLLYRDATMAEVAADLARSIGQPVSVDPAVANRRFSGVVMIDADRARMFRRLGAVSGVAVRRQASGWRMAAAPQ